MRRVLHLSTWLGSVLCFCTALAQRPPQQDFQRGGDISFIPQMEAAGQKYYDNGVQVDPVVAFAKHGWNMARLRVWVNPTDGWCDTAHTLAMAKRINAAGMRLIIDFHYSDWWADPGHQTTPAAWQSMTHSQLVNQVVSYTQGVISQLINQGTPPYQVDIGNEISLGMLWPDGQLYVGSDFAADWQRFADLVKAGIQGVKLAAGSLPIKIALHIDRGGDAGGADYFFSQCALYGVEYDIQCLSYYLWWQGSIEGMVANINALAQKYGKDIVIAETEYPFVLGVDSSWSVWENSQIDARFPASPIGQSNFLTSIMSLIQNVPGSHGRGILYWAPEMLKADVTQGYYNLGLFDFSNNGLPGLDAIGGTLSVTPKSSVVHGGGSLDLTVSLPSLALLSNSTILITTNGPGLSPPASIMIPAGEKSFSLTLAVPYTKVDKSVKLNFWWAGRPTQVGVTIRR